MDEIDGRRQGSEGPRTVQEKREAGPDNRAEVVLTPGGRLKEIVGVLSG
jgi:hypothetical protein